ncbi:MAG TPA: MBL fold metallo-hydrolase [Chryseosolibacter sp.]|nr:MBL fold metallo-hydrolase [Chryseosolibacter sp.]
MTVQCLGSGDAFGTGGRLNTCFLLRAETRNLLLDCGATSLVALKKQNLSSGDIDVVVITHFHADHFAGLAFILCEAYTGNRSKPLTIVGPEGLERKVGVLLDCVFPGIHRPAPFCLRYNVFRAGQPWTHDGMEITGFTAIHSEGTNPHSVRVRIDGKIIAYSGDTEWSDELVKVAAGADLFICEASSWEQTMSGHMSVAQVLARRKDLNAKKIVLTHAGSETLKHASEIPLQIACDGDILFGP